MKRNKKTILFILAIITIALFLLVGCSYENEPINETDTPIKNNQFAIFSTEKIKDGTANGITITVLVHKETRVMYTMIEKYQQGYGVGLEVLLDQNGLPLLYNGEF